LKPSPPNDDGAQSPLSHPPAESLARILDALAQLRSYPSFKEKASALCNLLAQQYQADMVALAWKQGNRHRLVALNEKARFERKMDRVALLEDTMQECADQEEEILVPNQDAAPSYMHEQLRRNSHADTLLSVPLIDGSQVCGVVHLQCTGRSFAADELIALRLLANHLATPLAVAHERDRFILTRLMVEFTSGIKSYFNWHHFWPIFFAGVGCIVLLLMLLLRIDYRIDAPFSLRAGSQAIITSPVSGYLLNAPRQTGDAVEAGQLLAGLDHSPLLLRLGSLEAEIEQYRRTELEARKQGKVADMKIAEARRRQAESQRKQVEFQIGQTQLKSPIDGTVLEDNDLNQRIGIYVKEGETLLTVADTTRLFAEIEIPEHYVHLLQPSSENAIIFLSKPDQAFPLEDLLIEPAGIRQEQQTFFIARATMAATPSPDWWRPGMTGNAKLSIGPRSPMWILFHRFADWWSFHFGW